MGLLSQDPMGFLSVTLLLTDRNPHGSDYRVKLSEDSIKEIAALINLHLLAIFTCGPNINLSFSEIIYWGGGSMQ